MKPRVSDNDFDFGPFTFARVKWRGFLFQYETGENEGGPSKYNQINIYFYWWAFRVILPNFFDGHKQDHGTWEDHHRCVYGVSLLDNFFTLKYGPETFDSSTTKSWSCFLPWANWTFVRHSLYDLNGKEFFTNLYNRHHWEMWKKAVENCPKAVFKLMDYDGTTVTATTYIEEMEWSFGTNWCKWLRFFRRNKVRRSLDICFNVEVGPEKGSWKGGLLGHSIEMLPGETHKQAMLRYCAKGVKNRRGKVTPLIFIS